VRISRASGGNPNDQERGAFGDRHGSWHIPHPSKQITRAEDGPWKSVEHSDEDEKILRVVALPRERTDGWDLRVPELALITDQSRASVTSLNQAVNDVGSWHGGLANDNGTHSSTSCSYINSIQEAQYPIWECYSMSDIQSSSLLFDVAEQPLTSVSLSLMWKESGSPQARSLLSPQAYLYWAILHYYSFWKDAESDVRRMYVSTEMLTKTLLFKLFIWKWEI